MASQIDNLEQRVLCLECNLKAARIQLQQQAEFIDTVTSPLWKRIIWWFEGFYFRKVGRWYAPHWTPRWPRGEGE